MTVIVDCGAQMPAHYGTLALTQELDLDSAWVDADYTVPASRDARGKRGNP
jgi:hypothetical protein